MTSTDITLRPAHAADAPWLERLAALDSSALPNGPLVLAEREGQIVAAVSERTLESIADPFQRTAEAVELLRRHAVARRNAVPARRHFRLAPRAA
ncbi:MAG TPA: hypothetical protein VHF89_07670 [Solirubrobacteraceae bacterium]|nr:hypothetical protein [Solirubrobacteraceae bacterium]